MTAVVQKQESTNKRKAGSFVRKIGSRGGEGSGTKMSNMSSVSPVMSPVNRSVIYINCFMCSVIGRDSPGGASVKTSKGKKVDEAEETYS